MSANLIVPAWNVVAMGVEESAVIVGLMVFVFTALVVKGAVRARNADWTIVAELVVLVLVRTLYVSLTRRVSVSQIVGERCAVVMDVEVYAILVQRGIPVLIFNAFPVSRIVIVAHPVLMNVDQTDAGASVECALKTRCVPFCMIVSVSQTAMVKTVGQMVVEAGAVHVNGRASVLMVRVVCQIASAKTAAPTVVVESVGRVSVGKLVGRLRFVFLIKNLSVIMGVMRTRTV